MFPHCIRGLVTTYGWEALQPPTPQNPQPYSACLALFDLSPVPRFASRLGPSCWRGCFFRVALPENGPGPLVRPPTCTDLRCIRRGSTNAKAVASAPGGWFGLGEGRHVVVARTESWVHLHRCPVDGLVWSMKIHVFWFRLV